MEPRRFNPTPMLLAFGLIAFGVAGLSIADMFNRRPWDGVVPADVPGKLIVREVIPGSGAAEAGVEAGDEILGLPARSSGAGRAAGAWPGGPRRGGRALPLSPGAGRGAAAGRRSACS